MSHQDNIRRIKAVSESLQDLNQQVVFVGGATISLYSDRQYVFETRVTDDVDVIVEVVKYSDHANFEEQLLAKGFVNDIESKIRCRYKIRHNDEEITVDIMPTTDISMGFKNIWYPDGFKEAIDYRIDESTTIKILNASYFIGTKFEAFKDRGYRDPRQSQDFEDIVYVLENRKVIWKELATASPNLKKYLIKEFSKLIGSEHIYEWIDCHVVFGSPPPTDLIINSLKEFIQDPKK